jgi:hypothetical protein
MIEKGTSGEEKKRIPISIPSSANDRSLLHDVTHLLSAREVRQELWKERRA